MWKLFARLTLWVIVLGFTAWFIFGLTRTPCERPLPYRIGEVDERFNFSTVEAKDAAAIAEQLWESSSGYSLFDYDESAQFTINFVFDSRQELVNEQNKEASGIEASKATFDLLESQYNQRVAQYDSKLAKYNSDVAQWNTRGGAPADEYARLQQQQQQLNQLTKDINNLARQLNSLAKILNLRIDRYNSQVGEPFDAGEYDGRKINIYQFDDETDLLIKLAHEFGHALALDHVDDPKAVMYFLLMEQDFDNPSLTKADLDALNNICADHTNRLTWYRNLNLMF